MKSVAEASQRASGADSGRSTAVGLPWGQPSEEIQKLWFSILRHQWSSLAIVPLTDGETSLQLACVLAEVGGIHRHRTIMTIDATKTELKRISLVLEEIASEVKHGERVLVALPSLLSNVAGVPIAQAVDAVLLCVELGKADFAGARRTIELVGAGKVIGSVTFKKGAR
jgi:hypothetical protein